MFEMSKFSFDDSSDEQDIFALESALDHHVLGLKEEMDLEAFYSTGTEEEALLGSEFEDFDIAI